ncbi:MAG TPA: LysR substrate-binding domain-containing protein [Polyangiaceae bacterium]|nr:LysR substrate-binding domain-containing protein [Polyangiaceae bacterium]
MDLDAVHAFVAIAETGGFAAAGRKLRAPRSTLSRQIQRLEEQLGVRLMDRTTRAIRLTEAGALYFKRCTHALKLIEAASDSAREAGAHPRGTLRVTAPIDVAREVVLGMLPAFRRRYPDIELSLEITQRQVDLVAEGFDLALRGGDRLADSALLSRKLAAPTFGLFASPGYLEERGTPDNPAELRQHDLVTFTTFAGPLAWRLVGPDGAAEVVPRAWLCANEFGFLRSALVDGAGIGLVELRSAEPDVHAGRLVRVLSEYIMHGGVLCAVYPSARRIPPKVRVFVDALVEHLRATRGSSLAVAT